MWVFLALSVRDPVVGVLRGKRTRLHVKLRNPCNCEWDLNFGLSHTESVILFLDDLQHCH